LPAGANSSKPRAKRKGSRGYPAIIKKRKISLILKLFWDKEKSVIKRKARFV